MPGKIFVNYRRDDERAFAARVRDRLAQSFGSSNVFMDVDNLMAGQRFDRELEKALAETDVFLAVMGPRWLDLYQKRQATGERDYVHEEIACALKRGITVIPVLIEGAQLPRGDLLPEDIRELVLHHKHGVSHENFGRDLSGLIEAIHFSRRAARSPTSTSRLKARSLAVLLAGSVAGVAAAYVSATWIGLLPTPPWTESVPSGPKKIELKSSVPEATKEADAEALGRKRAADIAAAKAKAEEARLARERAAAEIARKKAAEEVKQVQQRVPTFRDCDDGCPEMVAVPVGSFTMGSNEYEPNERPQRTVTIRQSFAVGKYEVTFTEWEACVAGGGCGSNSKPKDYGWGKDRRPVVGVSWEDAKQYVAWLSRKTGKPYRLLSEAEWEYAARARGPGRWTFGDNELRLDEFSWYSENANTKTQPVGTKAANAFGIHDMHGNVWEWVEDCWHESYDGAPSDGRAWTTACSDQTRRVIRGGSWDYGPSHHRSATRSTYAISDRFSFIGFRVGRMH